jgi:hypothetical protein
MSSPNDRRKVKFATLYERISQKGMRYFGGPSGDMQLVMFPDKPADDGTPRWTLFVEERDPSRRPGGTTRQHEAGPSQQRRPPEPERRPLAEPGAARRFADEDLDDDIPF